MSIQPVASREEVLYVSPEFKKEASRSIVSIVGFIAVYFLLIALSMGLVALACYGGIAIISLRITFYTLIIGVGLIGFSVMVFVFLVKFLFATTRTDDSDSIEITAAEHPALFETVYALAAAAGTSRPRKIFLSPDVNACVFYNSSFWSMFLPIRKNLKIGLGLVNSLNVSELKAVIAHEFGHFSQRSMKVGSWVYGVNKIIHNLLFNNKGYAESLDSLANTHAIISFFVQMTIEVVKGIQSLLRLMYRMVNKSYLALSRQMEFHADLVAASICGSNNIVGALRRLELADAGYNTALDLCNEAWNDKKKVTNFYAGHHVAVLELASLNNIPTSDGLPLLREDNSAVISRRINVKDQWASHPTLSERKTYLEPFGLTAPVEEASAWTLISDAEVWKEKLTAHLYRNISQGESATMLNDTAFAGLISNRFEEVKLPGLFRDFYNNRLVAPFDVEATSLQPYKIASFDVLLNEEAVALPKRLRALEEDIALLQSIVNKEFDTRSFDLDGQKYPASEAATVLASLDSDCQSLKQELASLDQRLFRHFYAVAQLAEAESLKRSWEEYFLLRSEGDQYVEKVNALMNPLGAIYRGETISITTIQNLIADLKSMGEPWLKQVSGDWINRQVFDAVPPLKEKAQKFIAADYQYFSGTEFFESELADLSSLVQEAWGAISSYQLALFKAIAGQSASLVQNAADITNAEVLWETATV